MEIKLFKCKFITLHMRITCGTAVRMSCSLSQSASEMPEEAATKGSVSGLEAANSFHSSML